MNRKITSMIIGLTIGIILAAIIATTGGTSATDEGSHHETGTVQAKMDDETPESTLKIIPLVYRTEEETQIQSFAPNEKEVEMLAKTIWGEARGVESITEKAAVAWCILNRVDTKGYACGGDIEYVLTFPGQFVGYDEDNPVTNECKEIAADVLTRWAAEKAGIEDVGRVLPKEYT